MSQPRNCHHILANGVLCQAAPLHNRDYCRFHLQQIGRRMKAARSRARHQPLALRLPLLEDLHSVQIAIMQLSDALAYREIDPQYGRLLTTVLRLAMQNLKGRQAWESSARFQLPGSTQGAATDWDNFEQQHDLPAGLDLSLDPELAFPLNPTEASSGTPDPLLRARIDKLLRDAETPVPGSPVHVTADQVEIMEVYEREGDAAMLRCIAEQQRYRNRRERRAQRLHYEEVARNHNIQFAAEQLVADRQREAKAAAATPQPASEGGGAELVSAGSVPELGQNFQPNDAELTRKPPQRETATGEPKASVAEA